MNKSQLKIISRYRDLIEQEIRNLPLNYEVKNLYVPVDYILSLPAKRMRALLVLMGTALFDSDIKKAKHASLAVELFHNFTLLHDDIMDKAPLRRGLPTVHHKWDVNRAILSGDAIFVLAQQLILKTKFSPITDLLNVFQTASLQVCEGQMLDMDFEYRKNVNVNEYLQMIRLKTASLISASLKMGAMIGGAKKSELNRIEKFGINLGIAFQLQDDLLDAFGDSVQFGKRVGGDIVSGKKTYLLIRAFEKANVRQRKELQKIFLKKNSYPSQEKIRRVLQLYHDLNIKKDSEKLRDEYFRQAFSHLEFFKSSAAKELLTAFGRNLMKREK